MRWSLPYAVEAVVFFACACQYTFDMVQYQFIYQVVSEELNFTKDHSVDYCSPNTTSDEDEQAVANEVSRWTMLSMLSGYVTCAVGATLFTSWSDSIGRKKAITFPVLGTLIAAILQCIIVTYRLPLYTLILTELLYGASGSYSAMLNIGSSYLSDTVTLEDRGRRFSILEVSASFGGGMVQIGTGYWINSSGFVPTSIFIACCAFVALILIPFMEIKTDVIEEFSETSPLLKEATYDVKIVGNDSIPNSSQNNNSLWKQIVTSWKIYTTKKCVCQECLEDLDVEPKHPYIKKERRWRLWFYALAFAVYMFGVNGTSQFLTMFLVSYPVCFTPNLVGAQLGLGNGLIIAVPLLLILFQGYLEFQPQTIILIGTISACASSLIISFAKGPILVFTGTALSVMYSFTTAFIRSEAARLVSSAEQGAALAVISTMENLACIFSPIAFLTLYPATLHIYHGFSLAVAAIVFAFTFLLMAMGWSFPYIVEVVAFFTCACQYSFDTVQYQFIYQVVSEELNFTQNHSVNYCSQNSTTEKAEQIVANEVSRWTLYSMLASYITGVVGGMTVISWSDSIGRKKAIAFPVIGTLFSAVAQCLIVTYRLPLYTLIITELVYGACGSYSALINIGCAYLSDTVKLEDRGRRYNLLEVFASVGGGAVQLGTGYWINYSGFVPTSIFISCCAFVAMLLIPFMKSTNKIVDEFSETSSLLSEPCEVKFSDDIASQEGASHLSIKSAVKQLKTSWEIYTMKKCVCEACLEDTKSESNHLYIKNGRRWRLWFYALALAIYMFAVNGVSVFMTMFLVSSPVCFTPDLVGAQAGLDNALIIAVPLVIILLQRILKLEGQTIILLGALSRICSNSLMSVAQGPALVFAATSLSVVYNMTTAFIRSGATRLVSHKEQGATLAVISGMENLACIFSPLVFLTLYPATLHIFHGFALVVAAIAHSISLSLMTIVWIADKRKVKDSSLN